LLVSNYEFPNVNWAPCGPFLFWDNPNIIFNEIIIIMIVIDRGQTNTVILELTTNSSLLNPNYLFEFNNDLNNNQIFFTSPDLSTFKCRYNRFEIIENDIAIPLSGAVTLLTGMYTYNIYEASAATLSVSATTGRVVQTGKVIVNGTNSNVPSIYR